MSDYETILVTRDDRVGTITLNRPKALNALNTQVMTEVIAAAEEFDNDPGIGAIILTGNEKAFAAGADIKEMAELTFADVYSRDFFAAWDKFAATRTPTIAAVAAVPTSARTTPTCTVRFTMPAMGLPPWRVVAVAFACGPCRTSSHGWRRGSMGGVGNPPRPLSPRPPRRRRDPFIKENGRWSRSSHGRRPADHATRERARPGGGGILFLAAATP